MTERVPTFQSAIRLRNAIDRVALVVSIAVCLVTIPLIFAVFGRFNTHILIGKIIQIIVIYCGVHALRCLIAKCREDDELVYAIRAFVLFFAVEFSLFVLLYPGGWRWDDVIALNDVVQAGSWPTWQHYLTAVFYMICMLTVPVPAFILLIQVFLICLISAYIAWRIKASTSLNGKAILIIGAFMLLLPPVVNMNLYPLRASLHAYCELLMFFMLIDRYRCRENWSISHIVRFAFLTALVSVWRTECIIYVGLLPILFFILSWSKADRIKKTVVFTVAFLLTFGALSFYQSLKGDPEYALTAYTPSLIFYAHQAKEDDNQDLLNALNEVYDVDVLDRAYEEDVCGSWVFWNRDKWPFLRDRQEMSRSEFYALCRGAFLEGTIQYPGLFLESHIKMVNDGVWSSIAPGVTANVYSVFPSFSEDYPLNDPICTGSRAQVASFVSAVTPQSEWVMILYNIYLLIPFYLALYIYLLVKRNRLVFALLAFNAHQVVTMLLAPIYYFMYYYSFYLGGIVIVAGFVLAGYNRFRRKNSRDDVNRRSHASS